MESCHSRIPIAAGSYMEREAGSATVKVAAGTRYVPRVLGAGFFLCGKNPHEHPQLRLSSWPAHALFELLLPRSVLRMCLRRAKKMSPGPSASFHSVALRGSGANHLAREEGGFAMGRRPATRLETNMWPISALP